MNLLILDVNGEHVNPMHEIRKLELASIVESFFWGPGYTSRTEMEKGLHYLIKEKKIDAVLVNGYFLEHLPGIWGKTPLNAYVTNRYLSSDYSVIEALYYCPIIFEELLKLDGVIKIMFESQDESPLPATRGYFYEKIIQHGFYMVGSGSDFAALKSSKRFGSQVIDDRYLKLTQKYHKNIISIPLQGVNNVNFCFSSLLSRKYDLTISGTKMPDWYPKREEAIKNLVKANYSIWDERIFPNMLPYKRKMYMRLLFLKHKTLKEKLVHTIYRSDAISNQMPKELIAAWRENYLQSIRHSKVACTYGGPGKVIVNKFFEVPAAGALMIGDTFRGMEKLGFQDGINFISCEPQNLFEEIERLLKDKKYMQEVANNGRKLMAQKHTFHKRAQCLIETIKMISQKQYNGSHWNNGNYVIERD